MKLGIVGLPNVGKSTLFNSLTKAGAESANYPFCTIDPNVGMVTVPDTRLDKLAEYGLSVNIPKMREDLKKYGIVYDQWFFESELHNSGYVEKTVEACMGGTGGKPACGT